MNVSPSEKRITFPDLFCLGVVGDPRLTSEANASDQGFTPGECVLDGRGAVGEGSLGSSQEGWLGGQRSHI